MKKTVTKNSTPSSEWEFKDKCPSCGSFCDIHKDLDENDECNDCRSSKTAVEFILNLDLGLDEQGKEFRVKDALSVNKIKHAKEMEKEQREKDFVEGYKKRAELSNLIFDEASELVAKELFNKTIKSE